MSKEKKKIVIPDEEEVAEFGQSTSEGESASEDATEAATPVETGEAADEAGAWKDKFLRSKAELLNFQRRAEKDRNDALKYANAGLIKAILPAIDDLERVIQQGSNQKDSNALLDGVRLTLENFNKVLMQFGVKVIDASGQEFDPAIHEAMMEQPSDDHPNRTVLQELAKGYRLHDRVLRPAKVIVSKASEPASQEADHSSDQE